MRQMEAGQIAGGTGNSCYGYYNSHEHLLLHVAGEENVEGEGGEGVMSAHLQGGNRRTQDHSALRRDEH